MADGTSDTATDIFNAARGLCSATLTGLVCRHLIIRKLTEDQGEDQSLNGDMTDRDQRDPGTADKKRYCLFHPQSKCQ
jgi:hypothetical protein